MSHSMIATLFVPVLLSLTQAAGSFAQTQPRFAELGSCATSSGSTIADCRLAYMTFGTPAADGSNTVLIPSWYGGSPAALVRLLGSDAMVDTTRFHVVLVGAFGDGLSTSPSNSTQQPGDSFPRVTLRDNVAAQRRLLSEELGITRLHAVLGFSMGAMQALEWAVSYPESVAAVVALHGTPQLSPHDMFTMRALRWMARLADSGLPPDSAYLPLADIWNVIRATPVHINGSTTRQDVGLRALEAAAGWSRFQPADNRLQLDAIIAHDVAEPFAGDLERAAAAVRARLLVVTAADDRIVGPEASRRLADLVGARLLEVASPCGHFALYCESAIAAEVRAFLEGAATTAAMPARGGQ
jgi:homoserine O-acetyltransferase/O-succinyltransferase